MDKNTDICSYHIKSRWLINYVVYIDQPISMYTSLRWVKAFNTGKLSVEDDTHCGRP